MSERMAPYYCPYCGEEDLRPSEAGPGAWECRSCVRVFSVTFVGIAGRRSREVEAAGPKQGDKR